MDTRGQFLQAAETLFARKGVDSVGVQEICDAVQLTKPSLYHHFGNKEGLIRGVVDRGFVELFAKLDELGPYDRDLPWYLERQARLWVESVRTQPDWFRVQLSLTFLPTENPAANLVRPGLLSLDQRLESLFRQASDQHGNMKGRAVYLALGWHGALNHWTQLELSGWRVVDDDLVRTGTKQFLHGIFS